ncbi:hypothetical protein M758_11G158400 [Ceratodon purpureus]|nr:hypothetical protein M758_11G158400 [Ceratodon purpureus]
MSSESGSDSSSSSSQDTSHASDESHGSDSLYSAYKSTASRREAREKRKRKNMMILKASDVAIHGWEEAPQPWKEQHCRHWISWAHILRHWDANHQESLAKDFVAPLKLCTNTEFQMRLTTAYQKIYRKKYANPKISYWMAAMVYAETFLDRIVDWNVSDKKHNFKQYTRKFQEGIPVGTQLSRGDAPAALPQLPQLHMIPSNEDDDDLPLSKRVVHLNRNGKRPLEPSGDDEDDHLTITKFRQKESLKGANEASYQHNQHLEEEIEYTSNEDRNQDENNEEYVEDLKAQISQLKQELQIQNQEYANLQGLIPRLREHLQREEIEKKMLHEEMEGLKKLNDVNKDLQGQFLKLKADLQREASEKRMLHEEVEKLKETNDEHMILQAQIPKLKDDLLREASEKRMLHEEVEKLKKTNDKHIILQAQVPKLKDDLLREAAEKRALQEKIKDDLLRGASEKRMLHLEIENLKKTYENYMILQAQLPKLKDDLLREASEKRALQEKIKDGLLRGASEKRMLHLQIENLKKTNENYMILQAQVPKLKDDLLREASEKRMLHAEIENLKKTNENYMILQAQIPKLKDDLLREASQKKALQAVLMQTNVANTDLQAQILRLKEDLQREEKLNGEDQLKIQGLEKELERIKTEKRMIVQLDENQFDRFTDLISQRVQGSNEAR